MASRPAYDKALLAMGVASTRVGRHSLMLHPGIAGPDDLMSPMCRIVTQSRRLVTLLPCNRVIGMAPGSGARNDPEVGPKPDDDTATTHLTAPLSVLRRTDPSMVPEGPEGVPTGHLEHRHWRPGPARSRTVPDRATQLMEHRGGVQASLHPSPGDIQK